MRISHAPSPDQTKRSALAAPAFMADTIEPTQSMVDGKYYTSKSAIRSTYKPSGNADGKRYIEVGNDPLITKPVQKLKPDKKAIRDSVRKAFSRAGLGA
jgi:hypothetical protein